MDSAIPATQARSKYSRRQFLTSGIGGAGAIGVGALLAACGSSTTAPTTTLAPSSKPVTGGTLRVGCIGGGSSDTVDVQNCVNSIDFARAPQLSNTLVEVNYDDRPIMALAEEVLPNATGTEWTIKLRKGVEFHNHKTMTAQDVIFSFQRIANPKKPLAGASGIALCDVAHIKKVNNYELTIPCKAPFSTFIEALPGWGEMSIVPVGYDPTHPVGTGPFMFTSFTPGVQSTFSKFPNYWQSGLPYLATVIISDYTDETAQVNALLAGQMDAIDLLSYPSINPLESGGKKVNVSNGGGWVPFTMRVDVAPFNDVRVRQAMRLIVDRPQMLDLVFGGHGTIGNDVFGREDPAYDTSLPQRVQDIPQAKSLLKQAGHEGLTTTLVTGPIHEGAVASAQVIKQQAAAAGVTINLQQVTSTEFFGQNYLKWTFAQDWWSANYYLRQVAYATIPSAPWDETHFDDPTYNALYSQALATVDVAKRTDIIHEMSMIDYTRGGYIIPFFTPVISGYAANLVGVVDTTTGDALSNYLFKNFWFKKS